MASVSRSAPHGKRQRERRNAAEPAPTAAAAATAASSFEAAMAHVMSRDLKGTVSCMLVGGPFGVLVLCL